MFDWKNYYMAKYSLEVEIDILPHTGNQSLRGHWRKRYGEANRVKRFVYMAVARLRPENPLKQAKLTLTRISTRECDFDGLVTSFKHVIDGLKEAGVIEDDKPSNIGQSTYLWAKGKQREGKIRIKIEEL